MRRLLIAVAAVLPACARAEPEARPQPPIALRTMPAARDSLRLELVPSPGWKINARLKPVLESRDADLIRFDSPELTPDSAYFTAPPAAVIARGHAPIRGTLRASVCAAGESVCRVVKVELGAT